MVVLTVVDVEVIEAPAAVALPQATNATAAIVPVIGKSTLNNKTEDSNRVTQDSMLGSFEYPDHTCDQFENARVFFHPNFIIVVLILIHLLMALQFLPIKSIRCCVNDSIVVVVE